MTYQSVLTEHAVSSAKQHARAEYPRESCGLVVKGIYVPCENIAANKETDFEIAPATYARYAAKGIDAVIHSHPGGPLFPTRLDMEGQVATGVPWAIIPLDDERTGDPILWGRGVPTAPIVGRPFVHGIWDCFSLIRDTFAAGKDELARQGVTDKWPIGPVTLPEVPRDDGWWEQDGVDLYVEGLQKGPYRIIDVSEVKPGDGFLLKLHSDKLNHGGLYVGDNLILHHLPKRLSRREPAGGWGRSAEIWFRHEALENA